MKPILRLSRNAPFDHRYKIGILQLRLESTDPGRHQAVQLAHRKALADTTPRPVEEGQELVVRALAIGRGGVDRASLLPSLWFELRSVGTP